MKIPENKVIKLINLSVKRVEYFKEVVAMETGTTKIIIYTDKLNLFILLSVEIDSKFPLLLPTFNIDFKDCKCF